MKFKNIVLVGMMGSGKSSVAKLLAQKLGFKIIDLDILFEQQQGMKISDYFSFYSEEKFREIETQLLKENIFKEDVIISTGGGVVLKKENQELLFNSEIFSVFLKANRDEIYDRIKNDNSRPLLKVENVKGRISEILQSREKFYSLAKFQIDTNQKEIIKVVDEIVELWKKY